MSNDNINLRIMTIALSVAFVLTSFMFVYSKTLQRSADDLVKIRSVKETSSAYSQAYQCKNDGGEPEYWPSDGAFKQCNFKK